jgi:hypothetical protein
MAFIRELAERGHQITLVCLVQPQCEASYLPEIAPFCDSVHPIYLQRYEPYIRVLASMATPTPLSVAYCSSQQFRNTVEHLAQTHII